MSEKNPDKLPQTPTPNPERKPNGFQRVMRGIGNGMESVGKGLASVVKGVARIPVELIKGADALVSHIPIAGEVYGAGKEIAKGVWGMGESLPIVGSVLGGLREGSYEVAKGMGFTDQDLGKILQLQEGLIITPEKLQKMLDESTHISPVQRDILETALLTYKTQIEQGASVSPEELYELQESIRFAARSGKDVAEKSDTLSGAPSLQSLSFSENPISKEQYSTLTTSSNDFSPPRYEALNDQQKKLLDFCREKICTDGSSPTQEQKALMSAMAYVSEVFETGKEGDMQKMVDRMREVKTRYGSTFPAPFRTYFEESLLKGEKSLSAPAKLRGGH